MVGEATLVIDTSEPAPEATLTVAVLLAASPSGMVDETANAAVTAPFTLVTAGTVRAGAAPPGPSEPGRVQVMVPLRRG